ncbi:MAG: V-type ATP synthase subunit K [Lentisphaeria bacterium]
MDASLVVSLGKLGAVCAVTFAAMGSALGTGAAGMAAVGAWKKCYAQNRAAPFMLIAFVGAPLTQTIYGLILMNSISEIATGLTAANLNFVALVGAGLFGGIAMGMSAMMQGRAAAGASDALAETGKGFGNYLIVLGIIETVALFVMVFVGFLGVLS